MQLNKEAANREFKHQLAGEKTLIQKIPELAVFVKHTGCVDFTIKMFSLLYTFCLHFYLISIHIFDYPDSRLSGLFTAVPTSPDNPGSTV